MSAVINEPKLIKAFEELKARQCCRHCDVILTDCNQSMMWYENICDFCHLEEVECEKFGHEMGCDRIED